MSGNRLADKVALVTGASRGIGRAIALRFADEGARVVVNCEARSADATAVVDVASKADVDQLVAATMDQLGRVDILSNAYLCSKAVAPLMPRGPLPGGLPQQLEAGA